MSIERRYWLALALAVVVFALALDVLIRHDPISVDFHTYLAASQVGLERGWSHVYDQSTVISEQYELDPAQRLQPFLSPPTVAFATAPLTLLPYDAAYFVWAIFCFAVFAASMAWSGTSKGLSRWIAVVGALAPWWVMHAVNVGQVVPIVAAGTVVAWRMLRDKREILAGVALLAILLKPNTAILVPVAVLFAGRFRAFASWVVGAAVLSVVVLMTFGTDGIAAYIAQLRGPLPTGADDLTLHGVLGATGAFALVVRVLIVGAVLAASYKLRETPGLVVPLAIVGSLVIAPYLHASDLCMLAGAGFMVWETRPVVSWRALLAAGWLLASPFLYLEGYSPHLKQWPWFEFALLAAFVIAAWGPLTRWADSGRRTPA
ncbi:MAG TPA: glycosyltransferase family 87 protein [Candidatus Udaeobacter sp.]|nr:glycosyltransferase family 87 protein [Candidatus Udaeobacter sp.]